MLPTSSKGPDINAAAKQSAHAGRSAAPVLPGMAAKLVLILIGVLLGSLPIGGYLWWRSANSATNFSSVSDLRRAMMQRDDRDLKSDQSVSLRSIIFPHESPEIIYDLIPSLQVKFQGVPVHINSCGMRSPERPTLKPANVYRIALLGDSFAFGWGVEADKIFAQVTENILTRRVSSKQGRVEVINFGVPGYSTFQETAKYLELGSDFDIDAVVIFFVENDFGLPFFLGSPTGGSGIGSNPLMSAVDFARNVWENKAEHHEEKQFLRSRLDPNGAIKRLNRAIREKGITLSVAVNPGKNWDKDVRRLGVLRREIGVRLIPMREEILSLIKDRQIPERDLSLKDDPHPSPIKHQLLGEILAGSFFADVDKAFP